MLTLIIGAAVLTAPTSQESEGHRALRARSVVEADGNHRSEPSGAGGRGSRPCARRSSTGSSGLPTRVVTRVSGGGVAQEDAEHPQCAEEQRSQVTEQRQVEGSATERDAGIIAKLTARGGAARPALGGAAFLLVSLGWLLLLIGRTRSRRIGGLALLTAGVSLLVYLLQA